jgi:acetyl/propionyl-CoA carboxylase alpha subunit
MMARSIFFGTRTIDSLVLFIVAFFWAVYRVSAQTTVSTLSQYRSTGNTNAIVTFNLENTNGYAIVITGFSVTSVTASASATYALYWRANTISSSDTIQTANGWTQMTLASTTATSTSGAVATLTVTGGNTVAAGEFVVMNLQLPLNLSPITLYCL